MDRKILEQCYAYGMEAYPEEACGMISGSIGQEGLLEEVHPMKNKMNDYHAQDPETYPRDNRNGYMIDPLAQIKLEKALKQQQRCVRIIYHSHPDVGAYFSEKDKEDALWNGEPRLPGVDYLVCGIRQKQPDGAILAQFNPTTKEFDILTID